MDNKQHSWQPEQDGHESCINCNAKRIHTNHGYEYWCVVPSPTPWWIKHLVEKEYIDYPVYYGAAIPYCAKDTTELMEMLMNGLRGDQDE